MFHCLATYSSQVSRDDYRKITVDWLDALLRATEQAAPQAHFALFSAAGARPDGGGFSFALRMKGEAENRLLAAALPVKIAFRPAVIAPSRPKPPRTSLSFGDSAAAFIVRSFPAAGVAADDLAQAMLRLMRAPPETSAVLENRDLRKALA